MFRDYTVTSPSLDGILYHENIEYEGIERPTEVIRAFDKPKNERLSELNKPENRKVLDEYFNDLYGLFMRKMGLFVSIREMTSENEVKLQAMLQELIKIKKMLAYEEMI